MLYDTKGRFVLHAVTPDESKYKLLKIVGVGTQTKGVPFVVSHDGRTIRYPDPIIKKDDTVKLDLATGKVGWLCLGERKQLTRKLITTLW